MQVRQEGEVGAAELMETGELDHLEQRASDLREVRHLFHQQFQNIFQDSGFSSTVLGFETLTYSFSSEAILCAWGYLFLQRRVLLFCMWVLNDTCGCSFMSLFQPSLSLDE